MNLKKIQIIFILSIFLIIILLLGNFYFNTPEEELNHQDQWSKQEIFNTNSTGLLEIEGSNIKVSENYIHAIWYGMTENDYYIYYKRGYLDNNQWDKMKIIFKLRISPGNNIYNYILEPILNSNNNYVHIIFMEAKRLEFPSK
jgi:hypothetical protein